MMKTIFTASYAGRLFLASVLLSMCSVLTACISSSQQRQKILDREILVDIAGWQATGGPPVMKCSDNPNRPFLFEILPPMSGIAPQAYTSMRGFAQAVAAARTPVWVCGVIGGSHIEPDVAQIAGMNWVGLGYTPVHVWHPGTVVVDGSLAYTVTHYEVYEDTPPVDSVHEWPKYNERSVDDYYTESSSQRASVYGRWHLAYQLIPQKNTQTTPGIGLYAMQGFRCAIHMHDFIAARRYWALLTRNIVATSYTDAGNLLPNLFLNEHLQIDSAAYLNIPQDIRDSVWEPILVGYSDYDKNRKPSIRSFSREQIERAAQAGKLEEILTPLRSNSWPSSPVYSVLYCPAFYPDYNPATIPNYNPDFHISGDQLRKAAKQQ
jgi:hypothetical protein